MYFISIHVHVITVLLPSCIFRTPTFQLRLDTYVHVPDSTGLCREVPSFQRLYFSWIVENIDF